MLTDATSAVTPSESGACTLLTELLPGVFRTPCEPGENLGGLAVINTVRRP